MIKLCIFDMGGVLIRNHNVLPELTDYLGIPGVKSMHDFGSEVSAELKRYSSGLATEAEFWDVFSRVTGREVTLENGSLYGRFFSPVIDKPTEKIIKSLKSNGMRVICGTNVIKEHYDKHIALSQYAVFDKVYASFLIHLSKPDESFFTYIAKEENIDPSDCFYTDDLEINVESARRVGMHAHLYTDASALHDALLEEGIRC